MGCNCLSLPDIPASGGARGIIDITYQDFVNALHNENVIDSLKYMVEMIENISEEDVSQCVNDASFVFTNAVRKAADPLFKREFRNGRRVSSKGQPDWADEEWSQSKKGFFRCRDKYKRNGSEINRVNMVSARKHYKLLSRTRQATFEHNETKKLLKARISNIKLFWKMLSGKQKGSDAYQITNNEFRDYFMKLSDPGDEFFEASNDIKSELDNWLSQELECAFQELNNDISEAEIRIAISQLKSGKSSGEDKLLNEFFVHGKNVLMEYMLKLFNFVFNSGVFPEAWSEGLLIPLLKKGIVTNVENFRGITLLSVLGKLFTRVLNNRLQSWAENYGIYVEAQNGFRPGRGTTDSIFILHCLINKFLDKNKSLYTFFVDFSKAFDYVIRENLWYKMIKVGVNGKILTIIRSMYNCVKTKVFSNGVMSDPFYCSLGVRQGECLSPFLFSLYINDLEECLNVPGAGVTVEHLKLLILLYADDVVIFAESPELLQMEIDVLYNYCEQWKLKLNTQKSKILVFRKGNRLPTEEWTFGEHVLECSRNISYLGLLFSSNGLMTQAQRKLAEQANKACFLLHKRISRFKEIDISVIMDLFDKYIGAILNYSCEVWGFHSARDIEQVQLCFCKRILGVKKSTQNDFVYGELGRFPMIIHRYTRIIKYWLKIVTGNKCTFVNAVYQDGLRNIEDTQKYSWCKSMRTLLFELGFGDVWYNQGVADIDVFIACFQQRVYDIYKQGWRSRIDESTRASFYRVYKSEFGFSHHLDVVCVKSHRVALSRLIMSSHSLRIETGRWERPPIPRQDRMCNVCHKLGDEYHFLLECLSFQELRKRLIPKYYWNRPSMYKCVDLLRSNNKKVLKNLAKFVFRCLYSNSV